MIKKLKYIFIILASLLLIFIIFINIEKNRFYNNIGYKPILILKEENNNLNKKYYGICYTIEYEYYLDENKVIILSGELKLFNKWSIANWIQ